MTKVRPVSPSATMMMIAAVPTTRPASVSAVWTGWVRNRWTAVSKVSRVNMRNGPSGARRGHVDADAVGDRDGPRKDEGVVLGDAAGDLDVVDPDQADRHVAAPRAAVLQAEDIALVAVAEEGGPRDRQGALLLPGDDLRVDRRVGRQRPGGIGDLSDYLPDLAPSRLPHAGRDGEDLPLPPALGEPVEGDDETLADVDPRQVRLIHADPDAQGRRVGDARDEVSGFDR